MLIELEVALYDAGGRLRPRGTVLDASDLPADYVHWVTHERRGGAKGIWRPYEIVRIDNPAEANRRLMPEG